MDEIEDILLNILKENKIRLRTRTIRFPGRSEREALAFTRITRLLELIHDALSANTVISKRDIYYRSPSLFGSQVVVDRYVDEIAATVGARSRLNVSAVAKGLVAGAVKFHKNDVMISATEPEGVFVPGVAGLTADLQAVHWILVVEKEASFRSITESLWESASSQGIVVTGKGYPDIATRALVHFLVTPSMMNGFASPPIYVLVDFDPDGLAILNTYKHGSLNLAHENANLAVPQCHWLGLRAEDLAASALHASQNILDLTTRDRKLAVSQLNKCLDLNVQRALQTMLMLNLKAEIPSDPCTLLRSALNPCAASQGDVKR